MIVREIKMYECEICHVRYNNAESAIICEQKHKDREKRRELIQAAKLLNSACSYTKCSDCVFRDTDSESGCRLNTKKSTFPFHWILEESNG